MSCPPWSLVSACILLLCAAVAQALQGYPDATSVTFLLVGVTSVIHHSRLDTWWKNDIWRWLDYAAIAAFLLAATLRFSSPVCLIIAAAAICLAIPIWAGCLTNAQVPCLHAAMHLLVAAAVTAAIIKDTTPKV